MKISCGARITWLLIFRTRISDAVDYDDWDDSVPAEVLSQQTGVDRGSEKQGARLWPNKTGIPYMIDSIFSQAQQIRIQQGLRKFERSTGGCVQFKKRTNEENYVLFEWNSVAVVGMQGGEQLVSLTDNCTDPGTIQTEAMHVLGFNHEHNRPDRDDYIELRSGNLGYNFQIRPLAHTFGTKYDYNSITHYSASAFSSSGRPTIVPKKGLIIRMGRYERLSPGDVAKIKIGYKCPLRIRPTTSAGQIASLVEPFPNFSLEPLTYSECKLQFNYFCAPRLSTTLTCNTTKALAIRCFANVPESLLREMSVGMAEGALRPIALELPEMNLAKYSFTPVRRQITEFEISKCTTDRVTGRLIALNFSNLLDFGVLGCSELVVMKADFVSSQKLRIIEFAGCTIATLQMHTFTDLPDLQIITLEEKKDSAQKEYDRFDGPMQTYLYKLHCSCDFAWYRQWWRSNKKLKLRAESGEVYSVASYQDPGFAKEELYHPIDCKISSFPIGVQWVNYYTQIEYSINEPNCETVQRCRNVLQALSSDCI